MSVELKMVMIQRSQDELQKRLLLGEESFNRMLAEVKAVATDPDEHQRLLTQRVVIDLMMQCGSKKAQQSIFSNQKKREELVPDKTQVVIVKKRKVSNTEEYNYIEEKAAAARNYVAKIGTQSCGSRSRNMRGEDDEHEHYMSKKRKAATLDYNEEKAVSASASASASKFIKKQKTKAKKVSLEPGLSIPSRPPEMPAEFKDKIESLQGYQVELVTQKKLTATDLSPRHKRLAMPVNQVINKDFLGQKLKAKLEEEKSLPVTVIDPRLKVYDSLGLTKWNCTSSFAYVINKKGWKEITKDDQDRLKVDDIIQVWSFRVQIDTRNPIKQERLCFALVRIEGVESVDGGCRKKDTDYTAIEPSMTKPFRLKFGNITLVKFDTAISVV